MEQYKAYIHELAKAGKDTVFFNSGQHHASLVMGTIFNYAKNDVRIYAGGFSGHVSDTIDYKQGLEKFLRGGGNLKVLLQESKLEEKTPPKIFELIKYYHLLNPDKVQVKKHPFKVRKPGLEDEIHFTVADGKMFRVEDNIETFTAVGNFNSPTESQILETLFDKMYNSEEAKPVHFFSDEKAVLPQL